MYWNGFDRFLELKGFVNCYYKPCNINCIFKLICILVYVYVLLLVKNLNVLFS